MIVTKAGKLKAKFLPAVYFDSSVLVDYWMTEGLETDRPEGSFGEILDECEAERLHIMRQILRSDVRMQKVIEIRRKVLSGEAKVTIVISPVSLLELMEWNAESTFKDYAAEASGAMAIQRKTKKEVGDYLKKLLELRSEEAERQKGKTRGRTTGLEWIMSDTWLHRSFAESHGLQGLLKADIVNFGLTIDKMWQEPSAYAYLQLGISDIMHIDCTPWMPIHSQL